MKRKTLAAWTGFGLITLISVWALLLDTAAIRQGGAPPLWFSYLVGEEITFVTMSRR